MAERARVVWFWLDSEGRPIPGATVNVRNAANTANIADTIYAFDDPDTSTYTNGAFTSSADGKVEFYLVTPQRVVLRLSKSGYTTQDIPVDVTTSAVDVTQAELDAHLNDATAAHAATAISFTPAGTIAASTVQAAIEEVASEAGGGVSTSDANTWTADQTYERASFDNNMDLGKVTGDTNSRHFRRVDGYMAWGPGNAVQDVNLYRGAADLLKTDDRLMSLFMGGRWTRIATQSITSGTSTLITWDTEVTDSDGFWSSGTDLTIPAGRAGVYTIVAGVKFAANTSGFRLVQILHNGSDVGAMKMPPAASGVTFVTAIAANLRLAVGDTIRVQVHQDSGVALNIGGDAATNLSLTFEGS